MCGENEEDKKKRQEDKGEECNQELMNGPINKRECRDLLCCLLFIICTAGFIGLAIYGFSKGDPMRLASPFDSSGNNCGVDPGFEDYPYLYYPRPNPLNTNGDMFSTLCLKECPKLESGQNFTATTIDCKPNNETADCNVFALPINEDFEWDLPAFKKAIGVSIIIYDTYPVLGSFCMPVPSEDLLSKVNIQKYLDNIGSFTEWANDVKNSWIAIIISAVLALFIGFLFVILMRYCVGVIIWLCIILFIVGIAGLGGMCFKFGMDKEAEADKLYTNTNTTITNSTQNSTESNGTQNNPFYNSATALKGTAIACWVVAFLFAIIICCLWRKISIAVAIMKTAALFIKDNILSLLIAPIISLCLIFFWAFWIAQMLFVGSIGTVERRVGTIEGKLPFGEVKWDENVAYALWYQLFMFLWISAFIASLMQFILASSVCIWYFKQGNTAHRPISQSVWRVFRYHLGSLAFASLLLAIVQMIRIILAYVTKKAEESGATQNKAVKYLLACLSCYVACFERFIKFLNKNAYIQIALQGKSFCYAAKDAFFLIIRNPLNFGIVAGIGQVVVFVGKLFIAAFTAVICFLIIKYCDPWKSKLSSQILPTIIFLFIGYFIGMLFMSVYGMAADTLLQCFLVDTELGKKNGVAAQNTPEPLKEFVDNHVGKDEKKEENKV